MAKSKPDDRESIIRKFQKIHGGNFDYSQVDFINHTTKLQPFVLYNLRIDMEFWILIMTVWRGSVKNLQMGDG